MTLITTAKGDITTCEVDAIVNAANAELRPGGGVDGAIHAVAGPSIAEETAGIARRRGRLETGEAVITGAGALPARHVIHTVGPIWGRVSEEEAVRLLGNCYTSSLDLAIEHDCTTIAFPNISTGVYGFPKDLAAETATTAVTDWVDQRPEAMKSITFVCFDDENLQLYQNLLDR